MRNVYASAIATLYGKLRHTPLDTAVAAAYAQFKAECLEQFEMLERLVSVDLSTANPYADSITMFADIRNGRLKVFSGGAIPANHPLADLSPVGISYNEVFRAVHDYFGHYVAQTGFGPIGEDAAFREHRAMFSPKALRALTTETRGQNCYFNFGSHSLRPASERPYPDQKAGLLPVWCSNV